MRSSNKKYQWCKLLMLLLFIIFLVPSFLSNTSVAAFITATGSTSWNIGSIDPDFITSNRKLDSRSDPTPHFIGITATTTNNCNVCDDNKKFSWRRRTNNIILQLASSAVIPNVGEDNNDNGETKKSSKTNNSSSSSSRSPDTTSKNEKTRTTKKRTWDESYEMLVEYYKERGDSNLPQNYKKDPKLGRWMQSQRERRNRLSVDKIALLDALDFIWDGEVAKKLWGDKKWEEFFQWLVQYKKENGHCNVSTQDEDNKELAYWVVRQRSSKTNSVPSLTPYRIKKLESIGFVWRLRASSEKQSDIWDKQWDEKFEELVMYKKEHGHCNVPRKYKPNQPLADWVHRQREMNAGTSPVGAVRSDRKKRLDEIGFDWDFGEIYDEAWLSMYNKLKELKNVLEGSNLDRQTWASRVDQTELWNWELSQQDLYTRGKLDPQREALLEEIGYWKSIGLIRGRKPDPPKE